MMKSGPKLMKPGPSTSTFNQDDEKRTPARLCFLKLFLVWDRIPAGSVRDLRARQYPTPAFNTEMIKNLDPRPRTWTPARLCFLKLFLVGYPSIQYRDD